MYLMFEMGNAIIARLAPDRRSPGVVESLHPQRQDRVQDRIEEGLPNSGGGGDGSSIDTWDAPMPEHQPWSDFTAAKLLPNSIYLWACDEPQPGGSRPSRSDAWVAWIIIITQMICYTALIFTSPGEDTSTANAGRYTFFSVAAATYLMTSIAAADLGAGIALISEARTDMAAKRWVQRKMFGFMLLASFVLLAAASIRVLFKTSSEDVELVVGAATVLFIADVDEKVMVVLKAIPSKWRLFWVLEAIGLSAALALLGLKATHNASTVSKRHDDDEDDKLLVIYSWYFIFCIHPVFVTLISLLVNAIVASPKGFVEKHGLGNGSRQDWPFALVLALWILTPFLTLLFLSMVTPFSLFYDVILIVILIILFIQVLGGACWLFFMCKRLICCRGSDQSLAGYMNFRWTSTTKFGMICAPTGLFLVRIVLDFIIRLNLDSDEDWVVVPDAFHYALFHMWLVWCMCREGRGCPESPKMPSSLEPADIVVTEPMVITGSRRQGSVTESDEAGGSRGSMRNIFLGWIQANALMLLFVVYILFSVNNSLLLPLSATCLFAWILIGLCAAASSTKGVAFWSLATYMLYIVFYSIWIWISSDESVNMFNLD